MRRCPIYTYRFIPAPTLPSFVMILNIHVAAEMFSVYLSRCKLKNTFHDVELIRRRPINATHVANSRYDKKARGIYKIPRCETWLKV